MIIIADSSALIALSACKALHLLDCLFNEIKVPRAVYEEIIIENKKESTILSEYLKDKIFPIDIYEYIITDFSFGRGEIEAMALYKKTGADKLLVDDKRARKAAQLNGINTIGSLGILLMAKEKRLIKEIKPFIEEIKKSDIYIKQEIILRVLELAEE